MFTGDEFGGIVRTALARHDPADDRRLFRQHHDFFVVLKWTPKIVADMGFAPAAAGGVLVCASFGGALGALALSAATIVLDVRKPMMPVGGKPFGMHGLQRSRTTGRTGNDLNLGTL